MASVEARMVLVRIPVRQTRGGTPDVGVVSKRGEGGVRLSIGGGKDAMMTESDRALSEEARAAIVAGRQAVRIEEIGASQVPAPFDLGLLFDPSSNMVAMRGEVTIGQMRQFVQETRYVPAAGSHNVSGFDRLISEGDASSPMVFTNETDCLAFAKWALVKAQAQDPRIQTLGLPSDSQWVNMRQIFGGQQTGSNWERLSDNYFRSFRYEDRNGYYCYPEIRSDNSAFRLVGTYQKVTP